MIKECTVGIAKPKEPDSRPILRAVAELEKGIDILQEKLSMLSEQLRPVICLPEKKHRSEPEEPPHAETSPLSNSMYRMGLSIESMVDQINYLREAVEL